jgi:hypothetical protein
MAERAERGPELVPGKKGNDHCKDRTCDGLRITRGWNCKAGTLPLRQAAHRGVFGFSCFTTRLHFLHFVAARRSPVYGSFVHTASQPVDIDIIHVFLSIVLRYTHSSNTSPPPVSFTMAKDNNDALVSSTSPSRFPCNLC